MISCAPPAERHTSISPAIFLSDTLSSTRQTRRQRLDPSAWGFDLPLLRLDGLDQEDLIQGILLQSNNI